MPVDIFLKLGDIKGESLDKDHKDEIVVESLSWGLSQSGSALTNSGGGAGRSSFEDFSFGTPLSQASPKLFMACASGEHIKEATITVRKAGKGQQEFLIIKLSDIVVSGFETNTQKALEEPLEGLPLPTDQITLNFAKIDFDYKRENPDGSLGPSVGAGWNIDKASAF